MEPQQQQNPQSNEDGGGSKSSFLCRQSSTRWTPTTDQIRILKDLYYNNGVRSPSAEQIQRISARLRQYGKIEGKNVFYWFQNHKARERQKKRFTTTDNHNIPMQQRGVVSNASCWKPDNHDTNLLPKYPHMISPAGTSSPSSSSSAGVFAVGQMGSIGYGSITMEKSFRDCSISANCNGSISNKFGWVGVDPYSPSYAVYDKICLADETLDDELEEEQATEIETLPLFPMHGENISGFCSIKPGSDGYCSGWYGSDDNKSGSRTSLELTLNSYFGQSPNST